MNISEYLLAALRMKRMTQKNLAERLGISPAYVNKLCKGTKNPSIELLDRICNALGLSPDEFFSCSAGASSIRLSESELELIVNYRGLYDYEQQVISEMVESLRKKHFSAISKGIDVSTVGSPLFDSAIGDQISIPEKFSDRERFLIVEARGDSMEPEIYNGDCVVIERFTRANQGSTALVHLDTETTNGEYTIKKYFNYQDRVELRSINPAVPTMVYPTSAILSAERVVQVLDKQG